MAGITFFILSRYSRWKIDSLYSLSFYSSLLRHPYNLIKRCLWNREDNIKCVSDFKNTPWWLQRQHKAHAVLKVLASKPFLFFLSRAVYNVVKDHSGNASSAVTKYPYSKHISRACNPPPSPNPRVTFSDNLATCRKNFFFFCCCCCQDKLCLKCHIAVPKPNNPLTGGHWKGKYASLSADGGLAILRPGFFEFLKYFKILQHTSWHALLSRQLFIMMSGYSRGRKGKMYWERKQVKESAVDNNQAGCVLIVTD